MDEKVRIDLASEHVLANARAPAKSIHLHELLLNRCGEALLGILDG